MPTPHHHMAAATAQMRELQVGTEVVATSTANWLAHQTKDTRSAAHRTVRLGYDLATNDHVRAALAAGELRVEQAQVIIHAIRQLPDDLDPDLLTKAENHLVSAAAEHDAKTPARGHLTAFTASGMNGRAMTVRPLVGARTTHRRE